MSDNPSPVTEAEARALFADLVNAPAIVLAVSGGPDSTALLWLAARWRRALKKGPRLIAVTVDHGLRREAAAEARAVKVLAASLGVSHAIRRWRGEKPSTGLPAAAREARYRLLAEAARRAGATHLVTAHTQNDQAETVLMRLARGSGLTGLAAMARLTRLGDLNLVRPFLGFPKARLIATLDTAGIRYATDASNFDPAFLRPRLRALLPGLAAEGLDAAALTRFADRMARADAALAVITDAAERAGAMRDGPTTIFDATAFASCPPEIRIRLLSRAIERAGDGTPIQLGKVEALAQALADAPARLRRTLGGAMLTLAHARLSVQPAPPRRVTGKTVHHPG